MMREQLASKDLGERYVVAQFSRYWVIEDIADRSRHSTWPDEFTAIVQCAKANAAYRKRRGWK